MDDGWRNGEGEMGLFWLKCALNVIYGICWRGFGCDLYSYCANLKSFPVRKI